MVIFIQLDRQGKPSVYCQSENSTVVLVDWQDILPNLQAKTPAIHALPCHALRELADAFIDPDED